MANLGYVQIGSYKDYYFTITNNSAATKTYTYGGWYFNTDNAMEWIGEAFPFQLAPGESAQCGIRFTPVREISYNASLYVTISDGGSFWWGFYGWGATSFNPTLSVQPQQLNFPDTEYNSLSAIQKVTIANVSPDSAYATPIVISAITPATYFEIVDAPTLPLTLQRGESIEVQVRFNPDGNNGDHSSVNGVVITSDDDGSPHAVICTGYAYITAIESVIGFDKDTLVAFAYGAGPTVSMKEVDELDLDCEEIQFADKVFLLDNPGVIKVITDFFFKYEDLGAATLAVKIWRKLTNSDSLISQQRSVSIGTSLADEKPLKGKANGFTLDGEFLGVTLYKEASSGPLSLIQEIIKFKLNEVVLGSVACPIIDTPVAVNSGETDIPLLAFFDNSDVSMFKPNAFDLNCEEDAWYERLSDFEMEAVEKSILRHWLKLEDLGGVNATLYLTSQRGLSPAANPAFTEGGSADERVINAVFNTNFSGELIKYKVLREANDGPLSIVRMNSQIEPMGELKEE